MRVEISRPDFHVPSPNDFIAMFGCEFEYDEEYFTETYCFIDKQHLIVRFWIGIIDQSFSLILGDGETETFRIMNEHLSDLRLDDEQQAIFITLGAETKKLKIELHVWPKIKIVASLERN